MSIVVQNKFVCDEVFNEDGVKLGEIKFNPNDTSIMNALAEIVSNLISKIKKINEYSEIDFPKLEKTSSVEEFESAGESLNKMCDAIKIEYEAIDNSITQLENVLGKDAVNCFTQGTHDIDLLQNLIEYLTPYIQENRNKKIKKYTELSDDVMK